MSSTITPALAGDEIVAGYQARGGPDVLDGGDSAHYEVEVDVVRMPLLGQFESTDHYYGAAFHELAHSTGHPSRLNRPEIADGVKPFGSPDYSKEELVAEMTAAFVCGAAEIDVNVPHRAGYIQSWLGALNDDRKLVVQAAGQAQKAADLILGRTPDQDPAPTDPSTDACSETDRASVS